MKTTKNSKIEIVMWDKKLTYEEKVKEYDRLYQSHILPMKIKRQIRKMMIVASEIKAREFFAKKTVAGKLITLIKTI